MGTPDAEMLREASADDSVVNDLVYSLHDTAAADNPQNIEKLSKVIAETKLHFMHPLRQGKRLAVFDLDYTLFDCKANSISAKEIGHRREYYGACAAWDA